MEYSSAPIRLEPLLRPKARRQSSKRVSLAALRARRGVSLTEIAARTRIPLRHLEELERGDVSHWPAGVYAKAWAREYAREAGIDPAYVTAYVAPVASVEVSTDDIRRARSVRTVRERVNDVCARFDIEPVHAAQIAAAVAVVLLLALSVL